MGWWGGKHSTIPLPLPSHSCFLRGVVVLHGVREERRESERSLQSSKEWEDIVPMMTMNVLDNYCMLLMIIIGV
jgi:hypothetical protein